MSLYIAHIAQLQASDFNRLGHKSLYVQYTNLFVATEATSHTG